MVDWANPDAAAELRRQYEDQQRAQAENPQAAIRGAMGSEDALKAEMERVRGTLPGIWNRDSTIDAAGHRMYGGSRAAAESEIGRMGQAADASIQRGGYLYDDRNYQQAQDNAAQSRGQQEAGLSMLRDQMDMSRGTAATDAIRRGASQSAAMQSSLAGLARGGLVGQQAARAQAYGGNLLAAQQAAQASGVVRAGEAQQAGLMYGQAAGQMRSGDDAARGVAQQYANDKLSSSMSADEQNAARQRAYESMRMGVYGANQQAAQGGIGLEQAMRSAEDGERAAEYEGDLRRRGAYFNTGAAALETWSNASRGNNQGQPGRFESETRGGDSGNEDEGKRPY